jgi:RNA polymerase sigma-70 factor (ECF subfamily)
MSVSEAAELVRRITSGEAAAESELFERYHEALAFLLRRWTRDEATAEDLCQETFCLALEKIRKRQIRQPESLSAFLRSLAKNLSIQHYRRNAKHEQGHESLEKIREQPTSQQGQLGRLLRKERQQLALQVLDELRSERDRQVLYRFYIREETSRTICADLGLGEDHLYRVLHRARQRYRQLYERKVDSG